MSTSLNFRDIIDLPEWRVLSQPLTGNIAGVASSGNWMAEDLRNNDYASPYVYFNTSASLFFGYNVKNDGWAEFTNAFGLGGSYGVGTNAVFVPSLSPSGLLANSGNTTTKIVLATALPASVGVNQLANRGDGKGHIIRIIGKGSGNSGKIEERHVIANTSGTTPTLILDEPLSFTPGNTNADSYEFLAGSYLLLGTGALAANQFRRYDVLTASLSSLVTTGLIATVPTSSNIMIALDEGYVPANRNTYEGYLVGAATYDTLNSLTGGPKGCLTATNSAAGTLTGQAASGDAEVLVNQYRNYQIRIVEDTATPTAVGQRRRISSHTAGASPVYTLNTNWTVTPSATCKYVIENWTENIIALIGGTTTVYNYTHTSYTGGAAANTWDTSTWAVKGNTSQTTGGFAFHAFGIVADELNSAKASNIFLFRGNTNTFDLLDIAGAATGSWTQGLSVVDWTGTQYDVITTLDYQCSAYNPHTQKGRYFYFFPGTATSTTSNQRNAARFDAISFKMEKIAGMKMVSGATSISARFGFTSLFQDGTTKVAFWNTGRPLSGLDFWQLMLAR